MPVKTGRKLLGESQEKSLVITTVSTKIRNQEVSFTALYMLNSLHCTRCINHCTVARENLQNAKTKGKKLEPTEEGCQSYLQNAACNICIVLN